MLPKIIIRKDDSSMSEIFVFYAAIPKPVYISEPTLIDCLRRELSQLSKIPLMTDSASR